MSNDANELQIGIDALNGYEVDDQESIQTANTYSIEIQVAEAMAELRKARKEIKELNLALVILKNFAISRGLDLSEIGYEVGQKPLGKNASELPKEEILVLNDGVSERQAGRRANSTKKLAQPTPDELLELYKERNNETIINMAKALGSSDTEEEMIGKLRANDADISEKKAE